MSAFGRSSRSRRVPQRRLETGCGRSVWAADDRWRRYLTLADIPGEDFDCADARLAVVPWAMNCQSGGRLKQRRAVVYVGDEPTYLWRRARPGTGVFRCHIAAQLLALRDFEKDVPLPRRRHSPLARLNGGTEFVRLLAPACTLRVASFGSS
jgi:hypothetical protein